MFLPVTDCVRRTEIPIMSTRSPTPFDGLHVAIFEARMAGALADLVAKQGGVPVAAPRFGKSPSRTTRTPGRSPTAFWPGSSTS